MIVNNKTLSKEDLIKVFAQSVGYKSVIASYARVKEDYEEHKKQTIKIGTNDKETITLDS